MTNPCALPRSAPPMPGPQLQPEPLAFGQPIIPATESGDYDTVRRTIEYVSNHYREQPCLDRIAETVGVPPERLEALFRRWCGVTPKAFLQAVTLDHARRILGEGASLLDASLETGLSGPSRLHDLFVRHEALPPGSFKTRGLGMVFTYGFHDTPFGRAVAVATRHGLAGIGFADGTGPTAEDAALADMIRRWPQAEFHPDSNATRPLVARVFASGTAEPDALRIVLIGSDFEVQVWERLLAIPSGHIATYSQIARAIGRPNAARAVGAAIGRNPISFVVPCHRVVGKSGSLTGYHWGVTRKRAMLGWEAAQLARA